MQREHRALARGLTPSTRFPGNAAFWPCMARLAIYLEHEKVVPSRWQLFREAVEETVEELPERMERAIKEAQGWSQHVDKALWIGGGLAALLLVREVLTWNSRPERY
ncbi:hypothetical protein [Haliangium ochraceum]|nr:hypothetical protein [Haliangium ochraceum]